MCLVPTDLPQVNLPPVMHHGDILSRIRKYGLWQRHRVDRELSKKYEIDSNSKKNPLVIVGLISSPYTEDSDQLS